MSRAFKFWLIGALTTTVHVLFAQNETTKWYFGNLAALDFTANPPNALSNSAMNTIEGCASVSDASGNLLFYTDGATIWNQIHFPMSNGTGLLGNSSTTQAALILKQPSGNGIYY